MTNQWFDGDGHLTGEALMLLAGDEEPALLQRLEAAEHLAYCVPCMERYTALLEGGALLSPAPGLADAVLAAGSRKKRLVFFRQAAKAAACACLTLALWAFGLPLAAVKAAPPAAGEVFAAKAAQPVTGPLSAPLLDTLEGWSSDFSKTARQAAAGVTGLFDKTEPTGSPDGEPNKGGTPR